MGDLQLVVFLHDLGDLAIGEVHIVLGCLGTETAILCHEGEHEWPKFLDEGISVELVTRLQVVVLEDAVVYGKLELSAM